MTILPSFAYLLRSAVLAGFARGDWLPPARTLPVPPRRSHSPSQVPPPSHGGVPIGMSEWGRNESYVVVFLAASGATTSYSMCLFSVPPRKAKEGHGQNTTHQMTSHEMKCYCPPTKKQILVPEFEH